MTTMEDLEEAHAGEVSLSVPERRCWKRLVSMARSRCGSVDGALGVAYLNTHYKSQISHARGNG
jgi:hypothetical protein